MADDGDVGGMAGDEAQRRLGVVIGGERRLQRLVHCPLARGDARGAGGDAMAVDGGFRRSRHPWVTIEAKIIVGGEIDHLTIADAAMPARYTVMGTEEGVGDVHALGTSAQHGHLPRSRQGGEITPCRGVRARRLPAGQPREERGTRGHGQARHFPTHSAASLMASSLLAKAGGS